MSDENEYTKYDKALSDLLDSVAAVGHEIFGQLDDDVADAIIAAYLRSSYGADTFADISVNDNVARIFLSGSPGEYALSRLALCAYFADVAEEAAEDYVDKVLPGRLHDCQHYAQQDAVIDRDAMLDNALAGIGGVLDRFGVK